MPAKLKPTETRPLHAGDALVDLAKLDKLKATACAIVNEWKDGKTTSAEYSASIDNFRAALLDGHAVEEEPERFYSDENYDVWDCQQHTPDILVGGTRTRVDAESFAAALNRQTQRPVSPFGNNASGWLTFNGTVLKNGHGYPITGERDVLNALWDGNGEHDE